MKRICAILVYSARWNAKHTNKQTTTKNIHIKNIAWYILNIHKFTLIIKIKMVAYII